MTSAPSLAVESNTRLPVACKSGKADNDKFSHFNFDISGSTDIFHTGGQNDGTVRTVQMKFSILHWSAESIENLHRYKMSTQRLWKSHSCPNPPCYRLAG